MANLNAFNSTISARTEVAVHALASPILMDKLSAAGILTTDLEQIRDTGRLAEAMNLAQRGAFSDASAVLD